MKARHCTWKKNMFMTRIFGTRSSRRESSVIANSRLKLLFRNLKSKWSGPFKVVGLDQYDAL